MRIPRVKDIRVPGSGSAGLVDLVDDDEEGASSTTIRRSRSRNAGVRTSAEIRLGVSVLQRSRERRYIPSTPTTSTSDSIDSNADENEKKHHAKLHAMESFELQNRPRGTGGRSYRIHTPHPSIITATTSPAAAAAESQQRQIYTTTSSTLADDFRSWGYWVEEVYHTSPTSPSHSSSSSASSLPPYSETAYAHIHPASRPQYADPEAYMQQDQQRRIELLDLWGSEWVGRNFPASSYPSLASAGENRSVAMSGGGQVKRKLEGSGYRVLGAGNFTQGVRGVGFGEQPVNRSMSVGGMGQQQQQQRGSRVWSWCVGALMGSNNGSAGQRAAEGTSEGVREVRVGAGAGGMEGGVQRRTGWRVEEDLPRYTRGEEPPAYEEF